LVKIVLLSTGLLWVLARIEAFRRLDTPILAGHSTRRLGRSRSRGIGSSYRGRIHDTRGASCSSRVVLAV